MMSKRFFFLVLAALVALRLVCELGRPMPPPVGCVTNVESKFDGGYPSADRVLTRIRLASGGIGLSLDGIIDFDHLMDLHEDSNQGQRHQNDSHDIKKLFAAIFAVFLFSSGAALIAYSVNKSRDIGGWAIFYTVPGGLLLWLSICFVVMAK